MKLRIIVLLAMSSMTCYTVQAQLEIRSVNRQKTPNNINTRYTAAADTLLLPFWDDFSFSDVNPDSTFWNTSTGVLINGTIGNIAPSINVMSFDGNDAFGRPYYNEQDSYYGVTDTIVSLPINLAAVYEDKRSTVYLSFYWQMRGNGEVPEKNDSLILFFKDREGVWTKEWFVVGSAENLHDTFMYVGLALSTEGSKFFHEGFQFKFMAKGNIGGPFDAWHVDYVYLNQARAILNETVPESLEDRAIGGVPSSIFNRYTMIPSDVLFNFPDSIYQPIITEASNLRNNQHGIRYKYRLKDYKHYGTDSATFNIIHDIPLTDGLPLDAFGRNIIKVPPLTHSVFDNVRENSMFLQSEVIYVTDDKNFILLTSGTDTTYWENEDYNFRLNDTVRRYHEVHHALAYDDGSAEFAAGLNKNGGQLAIKYVIPSVDTLTHVDIYFPLIVPISTGERMKAYIYKNLSGNESALLATQEFVVGEVTGINEFFRIEFEVPAILSGEFYVALEQFTNNYIGIGLDKNNQLGKELIYVNVADEWERNRKVDGMLMIRPIFKDSDYVVVSVQNSNLQKIVLYPNPVSDILTIKGKTDRYEMYDLSGQLLIQGRNDKVDVRNLNNGTYLLKTYVDGEALSHKVIVNQH